MREFLLSVVGVVVLSLIVEVICPIKKMKTSVALSFSLVVIFVLVSGVRSLLKNEKKLSFGEYAIMIEEGGVSMMNESVTLMEEQVAKALRAEGGNVRSVDIDYVISELKIEIQGVQVQMGDENMGEDEVKKIVKKIMDLGEDKIWVRY